MMFINPRSVDLECCDEKGGSGNRQRGSAHQRRAAGGARESGERSSYLQRVTFIILAIYLFLSACLALFSFPLSTTSLIIPSLLLIVTICAGMNSRTEETMWLCAIACALGAFGKIVAIIAFSSIFGFTRGMGKSENRRKEVMQSPQSVEDARRSDHWLTQFFIVLIMGEVLLILVIACIRCNLNFIKRCFRLDPD